MKETSESPLKNNILRLIEPSLTQEVIIVNDIEEVACVLIQPVKKSSEPQKTSGRPFLLWATAYYFGLFKLDLLSLCYIRYLTSYWVAESIIFLKASETLLDLHILL